MRTVTTLCLLLFLTVPAFGELTKEDIRTIIKEEIAASEKRMREYIDLKIEIVNAKIDALEKSVNARIDGVEKNLNDKIETVDKNLNDRIDDVQIIMIGLVAAAIAIPQFIIAYRERGQKELEKRQEDLQIEIQQLREKIESMQSTPS